MSITSDIAGDHQYIEGTETVTLTPKNRIASADTSVTAKRGPLRWRELQLMGEVAIEARALAFNLFTVTHGSLVPQPGDWITDSTGVVYTIRSAEKLTLGQRWRCVCEQQP